MEHQASGNELWLYSWLISNAPWIYAGCVSAIVRFVFLYGKNSEPFRSSISDAVLCGIIVSVSAPVASAMGIDSSRAMVVGVIVGLVGSEVVRTDLIERLKSGLKAFAGRK